MSQQLTTALEGLDKAMTQLRQAVREVPYRREGFWAGHTAFVRAVAVLRTSLSHSRSQLDPSPLRGRRRR
ncbi:MULTISPECIES: hypothetical protein [Actinosynnema]|uniref:Uncharacterized protein n=2 Tax=Actinosynnema TaxID=40566 RepID=C6WQ12_ACTMD|nr:MULTISPECIES: hypothetical protein [Actinosynnema]ACU35068.1 hypothetical protein Amir_1112 [Actinosynnema mirum DSM 43827]ATE58532.1 hypothetical protein CNX65_33605 [Actinosynnema pretiosum]